MTCVDIFSFIVLHISVAVFRVTNDIVHKTEKKAVIMKRVYIPPYVPAKSNALKNISGSSKDSINGGTRVRTYGRGLFSPAGSFSTADDIFRNQKMKTCLHQWRQSEM